MRKWERLDGWGIWDLYPACRCCCAKRRGTGKRGGTIKHYCLLRHCTRTLFHLGKRNTLEESLCTLVWKKWCIHLRESNRTHTLSHTYRQADPGGFSCLPKELRNFKQLLFSATDILKNIKTNCVFLICSLWKAFSFLSQLWVPLGFHIRGYINKTRTSVQLTWSCKIFGSKSEATGSYFHFKCKWFCTTHRLFVSSNQLWSLQEDCRVFGTFTALASLNRQSWLIGGLGTETCLP